MKYIKKNSIIDAVEFDEGNIEYIKTFSHCRIELGEDNYGGTLAMFIEKGQVIGLAKNGDYILKNDKGPAIMSSNDFLNEYERVDIEKLKTPYEKFKDGDEMTVEELEYFANGLMKQVKLIKAIKARQA